jgi:GDSL-like Lipase/Acylhydrolase family
VGIGRPLPLEPLFDREVASYLPEAERLENSGPRRDGLRVAIIGDSFTYGDGVDWDDAYGQRLGRLLNLNAEAPPAEVGVWARKGYNTADEKRFLKPVLRWKPHLVILAVFLNDSEDRSDPQNWVLREELLPHVPEGWTRALLLHSRALAWIWQRIESVRQRRASEAYADLIFDPEYPGWQTFEASLDFFVQKTSERHVPFVAMLFPHMDGVGPFYDPTGYNRMLAALTDRSIDTLALRPYFEDKAPVRMTVYPGVDGHPSEIAHRITARALFEFLLDHGYVDKTYRPRHVSRQRSRQEWLHQLRRYKDTLHYPP